MNAIPTKHSKFNDAVKAKIEASLLILSKACGTPLSSISFEIKRLGTRGGIARKPVAGKGWIAINIDFLEKAYDDTINVTVPHEVAHIVAYNLYGTFGHDFYWKSMMRKLGLPPTRTHDIDVDKIGARLRNVRRVEYKCSCRTHQIGMNVHKKIQLLGRNFTCKKCKTRISLVQSLQSKEVVPASLLVGTIYAK